MFVLSGAPFNLTPLVVEFNKLNHHKNHFTIIDCMVQRNLARKWGPTSFTLASKESSKYTVK